MSMRFLAGQDLLTSHIVALGNKKTVSVLGTGTATTTSASFADYSSAVITNFEKVFAVTHLLFTVHVSSYITGSVPTAIEWAIQINGGADNVLSMFSYRQDTLGNHQSESGICVVSGVAAGAIGNVDIRWRRFGGAGTASRDGSDFRSVTIQEIREP